jgi:DNA helicase-2/ATP-dependent DNA helicase PcrA
VHETPSTAKRTGQAGSHWKDWLKNHEEESARMAYVASSRPKYRLIWAVKKLSTEESKELTSIGFEFIN